MTTFANVVINDGQATPVAHTFSPVSRIDEVAKWVDRVSGVSIGFPTITMSVQEPGKGSRNYKVTRKVTFPVLEVTAPSTSTGIQPAPTKAYELTSVHIWTLPERSTQLDRDNLFAFCKGIDAHAVVVNAVKLFDPVVG